MLTPRAVLTRFGLLFLASGAFHVGVWIAAGLPSLAGDVSWRKPIVFGFSIGVLFLSLGWIAGLLPQTRRLRREAWAFSALLVAELALIDMQQWRGVASHFNTATPFDAGVFRLMGLLITAAAVIILVWTVRLFRTAPAAGWEMVWAARLGMVALNVGNLIGAVMAASQITALKPAHGIALHAIQALPVLAWAVTRLRYPRAWRGESRVSQWWSSWGWQHR
jgi:hypothetical protein